MRAAALLLVALLAVPGPAGAHLNSPHEHREAIVAGRHVVVVVHLPEAVPGEARAQLRVLDLPDGGPVEVEFRQVPPQGDAMAPAWARVRASEADPAFFEAPMPLMVFGLFEAEFRVRSDSGEGSIRVPVTARNPAPAAMSPTVVTSLIALSAFLAATAFLIARALVADAGRDSGEARSASDRRRGLVAGSLAAAAFAGFVAFTGLTWRTMHLHFLARAVPPLLAEWVVESGTPRAGRTVQAVVLLTPRDGLALPELLESAGERVHVTVVSLPGAEHVEHAHGDPAGPGRWRVSFTPRVPGRHVVFVDAATREAGEITIVQELVAGPSFGPGELLAAPVPLPPALPPLSEPFTARREVALSWGAPETVTPGEVVTLQPSPQAPSAEVIVLREDFQVYDRLAPSGVGDDVRYAYGFPQPGRYRLVLASEGPQGAHGALDVDVR